MVVDAYIKDDSKWIKNTIYKEFGKFIYELSLYDQAKYGKKIDKLIVTYFEEKDNEAIEDPDLIHLHIAYNMPCIVLVSSPKLWKFLREQYTTLCTHSSIKIRSSLAASFHAVFKTLNG